MKKLSPKIHLGDICGRYPCFMMLMRHIRQTQPALLAKIALTAVLLAPAWGVALLASLGKAARWRQVALCRAFIRRHRLAFPRVDLSSLQVRPVPGGVSNAGYIWKCRTEGGKESRYFVKVFLPIGMLWAKLLPAISPFPRIDAVRAADRLSADVFARGRLEQAGVAVPECIAADHREGVLVSEFLDGQMIHEVLANIRRTGFFMKDDRLLLWQCGDGLGRIHEAGFSLIDAQPANCMWVPDRRRVYFLDMEYSTRRDERNWDLTLFLAFLGAQLSGELESEARELVLQGYWNGRHPVGVPPAETSQRLEGYRSVFQAILDLRRLTPEQMFS